MAIDNYLDARKLGLKEYHARVQKRQSPYLPVLEEMVDHVNSLSHQNLGLVQVPLSKVVGTATSGRTNAFAANFMPILGPNSEFCMKWARLYDGIVKDGLRQPVKALEYLNKYYLVEGNKRVSVMKFLNSVYIEAEVIRVIPQRTEDKENKIYFEFLTFHQDTQINDIWFSQEGRFARLCELTGHTPGEKWSDEDRQDLRAAYMRFRNEYKELHGDDLSITTGDAFLLYLEVFGYEGAPHKYSTDFRDEIKRLREEFQKIAQQDSMALIMDPMEKSGSLFNTLFGPSKVKAAFVYTRSPEDSSWIYWHELGRINTENALGDKLEATVCLCPDPSKYEEQIENLIKDGNDIIFTTGPLLLDASIRPSLNHPETKILNCSLMASYHNVRAYYLRFYEAKFLIGMIAGALTPNDLIGYIADYPIYGMPSSINAFALGARMVNPRAKVVLKWSTSQDFDPEDPFRGYDVRLVSNRDIAAPKYASKEYGLYAIEDGGTRNLAMPVLDWSKFYEHIIRSVLKGTFEDQEMATGARALNYWWGMSSDAIDVVVSTKLDSSLKRLIDLVHEQIQAGQFWIFEGQIYSQDGTLRCQNDSQLTPAEIMAMDWLADNVIGNIPRPEELRDEARALVELRGLRQATQIDPATISW